MGAKVSRNEDLSKMDQGMSTSTKTPTTSSNTSFSNKKRRPPIIVSKSLKLAVEKQQNTNLRTIKTCPSNASSLTGLSPITTTQLSLSLQDINKDHNDLFQIYVIGESSSGKTSFISQYCEGIFDPFPAPTIGCDFRFRRLNFSDRSIRLQIWDTTRKLGKIGPLSRGHQGFIVLYDITEKESFEGLRNLVSEAKRVSSSTSKIILVGNKADLQEKREVSYEQAKVFAEKEGLTFFEVSSKQGTHINKVFGGLIRNMLDDVDELSVDLTRLNESRDTKAGSMELF